MEQNVLAGEVAGNEAAGRMTWFDPACQPHGVTTSLRGILEPGLNDLVDSTQEQPQVTIFADGTEDKLQPHLQPAACCPTTTSICNSNNELLNIIMSCCKWKFAVTSSKDIYSQSSSTPVFQRTGYSYLDVLSM